MKSVEQVYNLLLYPFIFMVKNKWEECDKPHKTESRTASRQWKIDYQIGLGLIYSLAFFFLEYSDIL